MAVRANDPLSTTNSRRLLIVAAAASLAAALLLAFTGESPGSNGRNQASGQLDVGSDATDAAGVVRGRRGGLATSDAPSATIGRSPTDAPSTLAPVTPGRQGSPTPGADTVSEQVADEMRERFGEMPSDPASEEAFDDAVALVEGGSSVEDAVTDAFGPPPEPDPNERDNPLDLRPLD